MGKNPQSASPYLLFSVLSDEIQVLMPVAFYKDKEVPGIVAALLYIEVEMNYTYMVRCADGTLYTGWTNCLEKRLKAHNSGKNGAKYTKTKRPVTLVYYEGTKPRKRL